MIEPLFFSENKLFGVYQSASDPGAEKGVVICPPLFDEYRRTYRALSDLGTACAQLNYHVLRFDFRGTGDSSLSISDISDKNIWLEDIANAVEELELLSGVSSVTVLSVRMSSLLASSFCAANRLKHIAWDPILDGNEFGEIWGQTLEHQRHEYERNKRYVGHSEELESCSPISLNQALLSSLQGLSWTESQADTDFFVSNELPRSIDRVRLHQLSSSYSWPVYEDGLIQPREVMERMLKLLKGRH